MATYMAGTSAVLSAGPERRKYPRNTLKVCTATSRTKQKTNSVKGVIYNHFLKTLTSHIKRLEHDLRHALAVGFGVQRGLRQQHRVLLGGHAQLVVEGVVPDLLLLSEFLRVLGFRDLRF